MLIDDARFGRYIGNSVLIYQRDRSLFATNLNLETLTTSGPGVMLFDDVSPSAGRRGPPLAASSCIDHKTRIGVLSG